MEAVSKAAFAAQVWVACAGVGRDKRAQFLVSTGLSAGGAGWVVSVWRGGCGRGFFPGLCTPHQGRTALERWIVDVAAESWRREESTLRKEAPTRAGHGSR